MEFHQLRYVCAIAETGSSSGPPSAATSPSRRLAAGAETRTGLGAKLSDRLGRSVRLTRQAAPFRPCRSILHQMEAARAGIEDQRTDVRGSVAVGAIPTVAPHLIPRYTAAFARKYPEARLRIAEETTPVLVEGLPTSPSTSPS